MMPQMRCFAPSISPPIEPVVSRTKTISSVFSSPAGGCGGCGSGADFNTSAETAPMPTTKVRIAAAMPYEKRFMLVILSSKSFPPKRVCQTLVVQAVD